MSPGYKISVISLGQELKILIDWIIISNKAYSLFMDPAPQTRELRVLLSLWAEPNWSDWWSMCHRLIKRSINQSASRPSSSQLMTNKPHWCQNTKTFPTIHCIMTSDGLVCVYGDECVFFYRSSDDGSSDSGWKNLAGLRHWRAGNMMVASLTGTELHINCIRNLWGGGSTCVRGFKRTRQSIYSENTLLTRILMKHKFISHTRRNKKINIKIQLQVWETLCVPEHEAGFYRNDLIRHSEHQIRSSVWTITGCCLQ